MRKNLGIISTVLFLMALVSWLPIYVDVKSYSEQSIFYATAGVVTGLFSSPNRYKLIGLAGNVLVLLFLVVLPYFFNLK
ncbi:hypothetical protein [Virgibacillus halodenitrificans]|uniref:hypothetical protein n=1 Tax=Virgibacillus halodenitrificans TaxID=1482 RepID=UPI000EF5417E|nr:hypothetical protein [Virgibacillus halodenitrificans]